MPPKISDLKELTVISQFLWVSNLNMDGLAGALFQPSARSLVSSEAPTGGRSTSKFVHLCGCCENSFPYGLCSFMNTSVPHRLLAKGLL